MKIVALLLVNLIISTGASIGVLYLAPGYAPTPREYILAINQNTNAITRIAESTGNLIKRVNEIAPPEKKEEKK